MTTSGSKDSGVIHGGWTPGSAYALSMLMAVNAFSLVDRSLFGLLIPQIRDDLHISDTALGLMSGLAFAMFYGMAGVPIAHLADRWNRRNIIGIGLAFWSLATIFSGFARNGIYLTATRFMLGIGEACGTPPSTSIIADLFRKDLRPLALSCFAASGPLGILIAFPVLGDISYKYGWRATFMVAGVAGLLIALVVQLTVREPVRGRLDGPRRQNESSGRFSETLLALTKNRPYILLVTTATLFNTMFSASLNWVPNFLMQAHDMNTAEIGTVVGMLRGPTGIAGALFGGALTTALGRSDRRWFYRAPAMALLAIFPAELLLLYASAVRPAMAGLALESFLAIAQIGPVFALIMSVIAPGGRAVAIAVLILSMNIIGLSLGPFIVGVLGDLLNDGADAMRWGLTLTSLFAMAAGITCLMAGRLIETGKSGSTHTETKP